MNDPNRLLPGLDCKYGAPGRRDIVSDPAAKVHLFRVRLVDGCYDRGGAYWGANTGTSWLYCACGPGFMAFRRAASRSQAKESLKAQFPTLRFYR